MLHALNIVFIIIGVQAGLLAFAFLFVIRVRLKRQDTQINKRFGFEQRWNRGISNVEDVGKYGEYLVNKTIGESKINSYVFYNYKIEERNSSHQIDEIVVNKRGVFVIETKNMGGTIYGYRDQREWKQYKKQEVKSFFNPILQNKTHIYALKKILPRNVDIKSLVVFIDSNIENVRADDVILLNELNAKLNAGEEVLTNEQALMIAYRIETNRSNISDEEHVKNVKENQWRIQNGICPNCGGQLVVKEGKYGQFYGCSNYPKCKFTKQID